MPPPTASPASPKSIKAPSRISPNRSMTSSNPLPPRRRTPPPRPGPRNSAGVAWLFHAELAEDAEVLWKKQLCGLRALCVNRFFFMDRGRICGYVGGLAGEMDGSGNRRRLLAAGGQPVRPGAAWHQEGAAADGGCAAPPRGEGQAARPGAARDRHRQGPLRSQRALRARGKVRRREDPPDRAEVASPV